MRSIEIVRKAGGKRVIRENYMENADGTRLRYLTFSGFEELGMIRHALTTREGGVSRGCYASMNLSDTMGDDPDDVKKNYDRFMKTLGVGKDRVVCTDQKHTATVRVVTEADAGKGVIYERDFSFVDGLVTNVRGLALAIFASDCVPLYFVDPVKGAIGVAHSGWRGTISRIGQVTVEKMAGEYGTDPKDLVCAIGPSICHDCYEISADVAEEFMREFPGHEREILTDDGKDPNTSEHKYHLDLWETNRIVLEEAGVLPSKIQITDVCTKCNHELLFSHRVAGRSRGNNAGFLMLE